MWHFIKKYILQPLFLISFGGMAYFNFEILFRGYSHISMIICGGLCFYTIGLLNEGKNWHPSFLFQMILGSLIIITYEYLTGVIVNIYLNLHVWDYSKVPFNYRGQICIPFLIIWFFVTPLCIWTDDIIRRGVFKSWIYAGKKEMNPANLIFPSVPHRCGAKKCSPAFLHLLQGHIWEYQISWILFWAIDMKSEFIVKRLQSFSILSLLYFFKFYRVTFCIIIIFFCLPFTNSFFRNDSFFIMLYYCLFMIIYFSVIHMGLCLCWSWNRSCNSQY